MTSPTRSLEGKVAIVTGSSRGIGHAIATNLASKGCNVLVNYTSESSASKASQLAQDLAAKYNVKAAPAQADMGSPDAGQKLVDAALKEFGNSQSGNLTINIIINNAGVAGNQRIEDVQVAEFERQYRINVLGPLLLIKAALPYLPTDRSGRIVNISSVSSSIGYISQSVYGGTKAALEAMTRVWSRELNTRATVNAVNPGPVATDMYGGVSEEFIGYNAAWLGHTPLGQVDEVRDGKDAVEQARRTNGRAATSEEIAGVVGMLCSPESQYCTGSVVCANGGMIMTSG